MSPEDALELEGKLAEILRHVDALSDLASWSSRGAQAILKAVRLLVSVCSGLIRESTEAQAISTCDPAGSRDTHSRMSHAFEREVLERLARLETKLDALAAQEERTMSALDTAIASLQAQVQANTNAEASATALIAGIPALIAAAVAAAVAAGATPAELASVTALQTQLAASASALGAAVVANTPAAGQ